MPFCDPLCRPVKGESGAGPSATAYPVTATHRRGGRVLLIDEVKGPRATWDDVLAAVQHPTEAMAVAQDASISVRIWEPLLDSVTTSELSTTNATRLDPSWLLEVRRPVSYQGMTNSIGRVNVPSPTGGRGVWYESRNEQVNYWDTLICEPVAAMSTQPLRLTWTFESGTRTHIPDALYERADGSLVLVDVTRRARLSDAHLQAILALTRYTALALGWAYVVRTELSPQRTRNVGAIWARRDSNPDTAARWRRLAGELPGETQLLHAATVLGEGRPNLTAACHLVANRVLSLDLDTAIHADTVVKHGGSQR